MEMPGPNWSEEAAKFSADYEVTQDSELEMEMPRGISFGGLLTEGLRRHPEATNYLPDAGEVEAPTEAQLERQEVKDEPGAIQQAASIGSVVADVATRYPSLADASSTVDDSSITTDDDEPSVIDDPIQNTPPSRSSMYGQAVWVGFFSAIIIIALYLLVQLMG